MGNLEIFLPPFNKKNTALKSYLCLCCKCKYRYPIFLFASLFVDGKFTSEILLVKIDNRQIDLLNDYKSIICSLVLRRLLVLSSFCSPKNVKNRCVPFVQHNSSKMVLKLPFIMYFRIKQAWEICRSVFSYVPCTIWLPGTCNTIPPMTSTWHFVKSSINLATVFHILWMHDYYFRNGLFQ